MDWPIKTDDITHSLYWLLRWSGSSLRRFS